MLKTFPLNIPGLRIIQISSRYFENEVRIDHCLTLMMMTTTTMNIKAYMKP